MPRLVSESEQCKAEKNRARPNLMASKRDGQKSRGHRRGNGGKERAKLNNAVPPGELVYREQFGQ